MMVHRIAHLDHRQADHGQAASQRRLHHRDRMGDVMGAGDLTQRGDQAKAREGQIEGALWEKRGFVDAKLTISPVLPDDPYQCVRYKQGFYSGQAKLMVAEVHA